MLASRGFSYLSEDTAGRQMQYHADCDCDIVPSWSSGKLKGYDPDKYREMYQAAKAAAGDDGDWRDALAQLRRIYHDEVNDGVTAQSTIRWSGRSIPISASELSRLSDYSVRMPGDRFSSDEKVAALMDWTGDSCKSINGYLFGGRNPSKPVIHQVECIDEAISDHITRERFTVDRQMRLTTFRVNDMESLFDLNTGRTFEHIGYMATSIEEGGIDVDGEDRIATRILVPPGSAGVYVEPITQSGRIRDSAAIETLLPYAMPLMDKTQREGCEFPLRAGEPYLALLWLLSVLRVNGNDVPTNELAKAITLLDDEDKEEYASMLG